MNLCSKAKLHFLVHTEPGFPLDKKDFLGKQTGRIRPQGIYLTYLQNNRFEELGHNSYRHENRPQLA